MLEQPGEIGNIILVQLVNLNMITLRIIVERRLH